MNRCSRKALLLGASNRVILVLLLVTGCGPAEPTVIEATAPSSSTLDRFDLFQPGQGCSVIYATDGELAFGGNNEDYFDPLTKVWFIPGDAETFGRVYFGFEDYHAQGGMNEQGLFFDGLGLDTSLPTAKEGKQQYSGNLVDKAMAECATVNCVVALLDQYYAQEYWYWQFLFGDATGESAIIEPQAAIRQQDGYQVATNFYQSITPPEESTCWRYRKAVELLDNMKELSMEAMRDVMEAVHVEGTVQTLYSNVYDLKNQIVHLYYFHNYDDVVVIDLKEELEQGYHMYDLPSLFPPNPEAEAWSAPKLQRYDELVESRLAADLAPGVLQAYAGEYELPEGWGRPDQSLTVIARERSLLLRFPDYRQHELFPESTDDFFHVAFQGSDFIIAYEVHFGLDQDRRIEYLELVMGSTSIRMDRLGPESFVPAIAAPEPTATSEPRPTATPESTAPTKPSPTITRANTLSPTPTSTPSATPVALALAAPTVTIIEPAATPIEQDEGARFPWAWLIVSLVIIGAAASWIAIRRGQGAIR